mgnify:CR=1 FL=1
MIHLYENMVGCIARINNNHFVTYKKTEDGNYSLIDSMIPEIKIFTPQNMAIELMNKNVSGIIIVKNNDGNKVVTCKKSKENLEKVLRFPTDDEIAARNATKIAENARTEAEQEEAASEKAGIEEALKRTMRASKEPVTTAPATETEANKTGISLKSLFNSCLLYTSPSPRDAHESRMPSSA